jgi:hypothetical protein
MYNKLFTKILDSSIWLQPTTTRVVWLTMLAAMDETGFCQFASVANLSHRAIVPLKETGEAVKCLESPDPDSSDKDNEGRRIERVPGGWIVLNALKYRALVTKAVIQEKTRERVRKFREKGSNRGVTECNAPVTARNAQSDSVTDRNDSVTPSVAVSIAVANKEEEAVASSAPEAEKASKRMAKPSMDNLRFAFIKAGGTDEDAKAFFNHYESNGWRVGRNPMTSWQHAVGGWMSRKRANQFGPAKSGKAFESGSIQENLTCPEMKF